MYEIFIGSMVIHLIVGLCAMYHKLYIDIKFNQREWHLVPHDTRKIEMR